MKGINKLEFNQATMIAAMQFYLNAQLREPVEVTNVTVTGSGTGIFAVTVKEIDKPNVPKPTGLSYIDLALDRFEIKFLIELTSAIADNQERAEKAHCNYINDMLRHGCTELHLDKAQAKWLMAAVQNQLLDGDDNRAREGIFLALKEKLK